MISQPIPYDLSRGAARPSMAEGGSAVAGTHFVQDSPAKIGAAVANFVTAVTF